MNVILIGMPGCGKSTIGVVLAKTLRYGFIDGDLLIQEKTGKRLQEIIDYDGLQRFYEVEDEVLLGIGCENTVVAPGGSAVYYPRRNGAFKRTGGGGVHPALLRERQKAARQPRVPRRRRGPRTRPSRSFMRSGCRSMRSTPTSSSAATRAPSRKTPRRSPKRSRWR